MDRRTPLLLQHSPAGHKNALTVHQTEGSQARLLFVRVHVRVRLLARSLAVAIRVEMRRPFKPHVDGRWMRMLSGGVKLVQTRMPVLGPQMGRIEGAADGGQKIVSPAARLALAAQLVVMMAVIVMMVLLLLEGNQWPTVAIRSRRLAADVAAVLATIFVA